MNDSYFDLHLHLSSKHFLTGDKPEDRKNCWQNIKIPLVDDALGNILDSQSSLSQLSKAGVQIAVNAIVPMERAYAESTLVGEVAPFLTPLDKTIVEKIRNGTYEYFTLFQAEIEFLLSNLDGPGNKKAQIINKISEVDEDKLNIILAIEGGHALFNSNEHYTDTLRKLKNGARRYLYLNPAHLTDQGEDFVANQAYGSKIINQDGFKPRRYGISPNGLKLIEICHDGPEEKRILIDVKHMSLLARKQYYALWKRKAYNSPILASHVGVTGTSWDNIEEFIDGSAKRDDMYMGVKYKKPRGIGQGLRRNRTYFNPWSINLYDEEISIIIESGGMIGLSLDQRILGFTSQLSGALGKLFNTFSGEYFSVKEYEELISGNVPVISGALPTEPDHSAAFIEEVNAEEALINKRKHLRYFVNNLLHIVKIGGPQAWKHICIGSDFDGLIDPINTCTNVTKFEIIEKKLVKTITEMVTEAKKVNPQVDYHIKDLKKQLRDLFFQNGIDFLNKHFQ